MHIYIIDKMRHRTDKELIDIITISKHKYTADANATAENILRERYG